MNKHDIRAAQIVAGAMEASKLPPAAAKAVFRALGAADMRPKPQPDDAQLENHLATAQERGMGVVTINNATAAPLEVAGMATEASNQLTRLQDGMIRALLAERLLEGEVDSDDPHELNADGRLKQFGYPDGHLEYELNGKVLITFAPPEVAFEGEYMHVNARYRVHL